MEQAKKQNEIQSKNGKDENQMENSKVVKLNETQEVIQEIKEVTAVVTGSNENDLEIARAIMNGTVKKTELKTATELEKAKLDHEAQLEFKKVEERLELRRMELRTKEKLWKDATDTITITGIVAAIAATSIFNTRSNNGVKIARLEQGLTD